MDKRLQRLNKMKENNKCLGKTKKTACNKCGCNTYLVFFIPTANSNGLYCSKCGTWLKFENKNTPVCNK